MLKALAMAAMLSSPTTGAPAPSRAPHCLTRTQINDASVVVAATLVETVRNACRAHLPTTAWLTTAAATDYSARLRAEARQRLDSAVSVTAGMGTSTTMPRETIRSMTEVGLREGAGTELARYATAEICADANEILEISSTLSPDQTGRFFGAFASLIDHGLRMLPPGMFGPGAHPPADHGPGDHPTPGATPAAYEFLWSKRTPPPAPPSAAARTPPRPFMCRGEE